MSGLSLAQQLKQLHSNNESVPDPENAYSNLDSHDIQRKGDEGREHYVDVGPSRLRMELGGAGGGTLTGPKYEGVKTGRMKIFDDDDEEESGGEEGSEGEGDEDGDEDEEEDEEDFDEEEDEEDDEDDEDEEDEEEEEQTHSRVNGPKQVLDPVASLRNSRLKDIEKGQAIRKQKALFESLITLRITFQKALTASNTIPTTLPEDPENELVSKKASILKSLSELNERLFTLRKSITLPGESEEEISLGKRKRDAGDDAQGEAYWIEAAKESLDIADRSHPQLLPILNKWSSKIQAASLQLGSKQAGGSKFLQQMKNGAGGVVEAIESGINSKREAEKTLMESEETGYRALLREVIESRSGSGPAADLTHLRREKKKKREAERGGSKGRKLRYTVHEKAQNFVVSIPLSQGWHEEQVDELFSSLFGGVGMKGATSEKIVGLDVGNADEGLAELGGLRVF
ncbi:protein BFR2 [Cryptococcus gattii E566]|uniref:Protein BFR2 n=2 Tax=Cryptococcus gattii TaxID=37769 RepID=E6RAN6_CRYGW|nr:transport-related protein, putative [Cryptococcus gattii WM276]ADV23884.1 transport-related protein, putative [Cryptococcus gattii WM276]KIR81465.1 protein BFR2 [Cryptococcus gattii EJB2]KIY35097.1 protein BFR2 [Cryptococcus gattii E566]KJE00212.1 protein BFR2 [Cryptococcus gattii NT-10]